MKRRSFIRITLTFLLILTFAGDLIAQYRGAPVKKDRLVKALRSKQLQARDIVTVINTNGVDFALTAETRQVLIAAGARPEVIKAVADNPRLSSNPDGIIARNRKNKRAVKTPLADYEDLLDQAMFSYKDRKNAQNASRILEAAVKLNPKNPKAYQMLGFVNLYGLKNPAEAEKLMRRSIDNGGSAVFRVYHDDSGGFSKHCAGSLYVSAESIRFESDDNLHTFETSIFGVDKIRLDTESNRSWKKRSIFKVFLKIGPEKAKFRFSPVTSSAEESKMVERLVLISKTTRDTTAAVEPAKF
jgi:tetratricopeptide (TPR) repeat protein